MNNIVSKGEWFAGGTLAVVGAAGVALSIALLLYVSGKINSSALQALNHYLHERTKASFTLNFTLFTVAPIAFLGGLAILVYKTRNLVRQRLHGSEINDFSINGHPAVASTFHWLKK